MPANECLQKLILLVRVSVEMKLPLLLALSALAATHGALAEESSKSPLSVEVKRHLVDSNTGRSLGGDSRSRTYTLQVQITNVSSSIVEGVELTGEVLVRRSIEDHEKRVKETIPPQKLPAMKPNERLTLEFGKINVRTIEWKKGKEFEESLDEWKVVCTRAGKDIAGHQSSANYTALSKDAPPADAGKKKKRNHMNGREKMRRRLMN